MAHILSSTAVVTTGSLVGKQLFDVITSGMYDNPLMIYREYVQNAVDSIDEASATGLISHNQGVINIQIEGDKREIAIEDNGMGIEPGRAFYVLRSLGMSPKEGQSFRGFRGIGRLGGLAYCDKLIFETRSNNSEEVVQVTWDRQAFDRLSANSDKISLKAAIEQISSAQGIKAVDNDPAHFFRVRLKGIRRFHNDLLMSVKAISQYLSQVAPVPYRRDTFKFADDIQKYFSILPDYRCYNISLNGKPLFRPYRTEFSISKDRNDRIHNIEYFSFRDEHGEQLALGWYANTGFLASLPQSNAMRGIRVRQGNIEIGDDHFLKDMFVEERFAGWVIGEIHISEYKLRPNARRDGYEVSVNYEKFLEQASLLGRRLSGLCRLASSKRIEMERIDRELFTIDKLLADINTFVDDEHAQATRESIEKRLAVLEVAIDKSVLNDGYPSQLEKLRQRCDAVFGAIQTLDEAVDGRKLRKLSQKDVLKHVAAVVIESYAKCDSAQDLVARIIGQFTKTGGSRKNGTGRRRGKS